MKLNHITLVVTDIERSKAFYKDILNLNPTFEEQMSGSQFSEVTNIPNLKLRFAVLRIPNSDVIIELAQFVNPLTKTNRDFRHIAFEVEDVDKVYPRLKEKNVETLSEPTTIENPNPKINGKRMFYLRDPDGNLIELFNSRKNLYSN